MPIDILAVRRVGDLETGEQTGWHIEFEIWETGGTHYLYRAGNVPVALTTKAEAEAWLLGRFDELLAGAIEKNALAPVNILDNPNIEWNRALTAALLVILDQINVLRVREGLSEITKEQALTAIKEQYRELD